MEQTNGYRLLNKIAKLADELTNEELADARRIIAMCYEENCPLCKTNKRLLVLLKQLKQERRE